MQLLRAEEEILNSSQKYGDNSMSGEASQNGLFASAFTLKPLPVNQQKIGERAIMSGN